MRALVATAVALAVLAGPADARVPRTCKSPGAVFKDGQVRIWTRVGPLDNRQWWICSWRIRKPRLWSNQGEDIEDSSWIFRRFGSRTSRSSTRGRAAPS